VSLRIAIGGIAHETNSYAAVPTTLGDFEVRRGEQIRLAAGTRTYEGGMVDAAAELGAEVIGTLLAEALPGGVIAAEAYRSLRRELLALVAAALPVDAVVLVLHGAAISQDCADVEGELCAAVRAVIGPATQLVVTHDLHGHITAREADAVDLMFGVQRYPHDDMYDRGREAVLAIPRLTSGEWRPAIAVERLPLLVAPTTTDSGVGRDLLALCLQAEREPGVIDATFMHGFPHTDSPHVGAQVIVTTDAAPEQARATARALAAEVWARREGFQHSYPDPAQAIGQAMVLALGAPGGPVVVNETSDNPGGGAPGDGTYLLRALIEARPAGAVFCGLCDPAAAAQAHRAGVGATLRMELGGHTDDRHGPPLRGTARVATLSDGEIVLEAAMGAGVRVQLGRTAGLLVEGVDVIVISRPMQTIDRTPLLLHGIDPATRPIVAVKSAHHFRSGFRELAAAVITSDSPGITTHRLASLPRMHAPGPLFPLDPAAAYPA